MDHKLKSQVLIQQNNILKLTLVYNITRPETVQSAEFVINKAVKVQFKALATSLNNNEHKLFIFLKMNKLPGNDDVIYKINFNSKALNKNSKNFFTDDTALRTIYNCKSGQWFSGSFDVSLEMDIFSDMNTVSALYNDNELTDFELCGDNGSVHVHRAVLATCSPALRQMLGGPWKEVSEGRVTIPNMDLTTLQHLKYYLYMKKIPESGLQNLLLFASCYMVKDLEKQCINKLARSVTSENFFEMTEFATQNKITKLYLAILEQVQIKAVDVNKIREHVLGVPSDAE